MPGRESAVFCSTGKNACIAPMKICADTVAGGDQHLFAGLLPPFDGAVFTEDPNTQMENLIQKDPDIDAVLALNDEMALGSWQALDDAGLTEDVIVSGFDGAVEGCKAILAGKMVASMDQDAIGTGYEGVKAALTILEGGTVDEWIKIGGKVVSGDNAQDYLDNFAAHGFSE